MPYDKISETRIDTAENLSAARLLLTGIFAFGMKKKHRYLVVSFEEEYGMVQNPVFEGMTLNPLNVNPLSVVQGAIYQGIARVKAQAPSPPAAQQAPQAATIDVAEQIKKFGELRDQGLLTAEEFDSKKQELLARM